MHHYTTYNGKNSKGFIDINSIFLNNLAIHYARTEKFGKASVNHLDILHLKENKILTFTEKISD